MRSHIWGVRIAGSRSHTILPHSIPLHPNDSSTRRSLTIQVPSGVHGVAREGGATNDVERAINSPNSTPDIATRMETPAPLADIQSYRRDGNDRKQLYQAPEIATLDYLMAG